jgi:2-(1,2-epoxy-1,2-dihydrophenyl)acetyl-CoA isomerase
MRVEVAREGPVGTLTLFRPERHNALVPGLLRGLLDGLDEIAADESVDAVVLRGAGRSFSTGGDVRAFAESDDPAAYAEELVGLLNEAILAIVDLPVPVVGAVHGHVSGGSLGLVLAADLIVADRTTTITPYYTEVGFSPDGGWTAMLPEVIGRHRAGRAQYLNDPFDAESALACGLVTHVVDGDVTEEAERIAARISSMRRGSIRRTKPLLRPDRDRLAERLERERRHFVDQITTAEARAGIADFLGASTEQEETGP